MSTPTPPSSRVRFRDLPTPAQVYVGAVGVLGGAAIGYSLYRVGGGPPRALLWLAALTLIAGCLGIQVKLPAGLGGGFAFTISDCFVFMGLLLAGPAAAVCLGTVDGIVGSVRFGIKSLYRSCFSVAGIALTAYLVSHGFGLVFRAPAQPLDFSVRFVAGVGLGALSYFVLSSLFVAAAMAFASQQPLAALWSRYFPWASPSTLMSVAAGLLFLASLDSTAAGRMALLAVGLALLSFAFIYSRWGRTRLLSRLHETD